MSLDLEDHLTILAWRREAMSASVAWAKARDLTTGELPDADDGTPEATKWRKTVASLAHLLGGVTKDDVDQQVRDAYRLFRGSMTPQLRLGCPAHMALLDICHGPLTGAYNQLCEYMRMSREDLVKLVNELHRIDSPACTGFVATTAALAGCTTQGDPENEEYWE